MPHTLLLDASWDLTLDSGNNIATTTEGYAIAQNVANAVRLFTDDAYFDKDKGIPHFDIELGKRPNLSVLRSRIHAAAMEVEGVASATVTFTSFDDRELKGEIELTTTDGDIINVEL